MVIECRRGRFAEYASGNRSVILRLRPDEGYDREVRATSSRIVRNAAISAFVLLLGSACGGGKAVAIIDPFLKDARPDILVAIERATGSTPIEIDAEALAEGFQGALLASGLPIIASPIFFQEAKSSAEAAPDRVFVTITFDLGRESAPQGMGPLRVVDVAYLDGLSDAGAMCATYIAEYRANNVDEPVALVISGSSGTANQARAAFVEGFQASDSATMLLERTISGNVGVEAISSLTDELKQYNIRVAFIIRDASVPQLCEAIGTLTPMVGTDSERGDLPVAFFARLRAETLTDALTRALASPPGTVIRAELSIDRGPNAATQAFPAFDFDAFLAEWASSRGSEQEIE
jgi:hypothetical protein